MPEDFDWDSDPPRLAYMEQFYTGTNADLTTFRDLGGKMIMVQGWADSIVPPMYSVDYYEKVLSMMGGDAAVQDFFRFFAVPGLGHSNGPGNMEVIMDTVSLLEDWVENGDAPEMLKASYVQNATIMEGSVRPPTGGVKGTIAFERPLFPYPMLSRYKGGDPTEASSFELVPPRSAKEQVAAQAHAGARCDACIKVISGN